MHTVKFSHECHMHTLCSIPRVVFECYGGYALTPHTHPCKIRDSSCPGAFQNTAPVMVNFMCILCVNLTESEGPQIFD